MKKLNIGNSIFKGYNDIGGIMLCGYEWGFSKKEQEKLNTSEEKKSIDTQEQNTSFSNKVNINGKFRYDEKIIKWFGLWGHPLKRDNGDFEKCIIQTNWCDTQNHDMKNVNRYRKLINCQDNFLYHVKELRPKIIFFFGSDMIKVLNDKNVKQKFENIVGKEINPVKIIQKVSNKRRFKIGFQSFENCEIISLPHPTGSRPSDEYIGLFKDEIKPILDNYKIKKFK